MGDRGALARGHGAPPGRALRPSRPGGRARCRVRGRGEDLTLPGPLALTRLGYRAAHAGLRAWWFVRRPYTEGVKCILRDERGRILFVRHTYANRIVWELPGGGMRRREDPEVAVRREMREELGIALVGLRPVADAHVAHSHKHTLLHCFAATTGGAPLVLDHAEIAEARWASPGAPPRPLGPDAAVLLARARE